MTGDELKYAVMQYWRFKRKEDACKGARLMPPEGIG